MLQRCILHIGTEKTGTTSIQRFLSKNRKALAKSGYFLPRSMGSLEHFDLVRALVSPEKRFGKLRHFKDDPNKIEHRQAILRKTFQSELQSAQGFHSCIITSERLGAKITSDAEAKALRDLLTPYFAHIEVWVYLRPQVDFARSFYSTELRLGARREAVLPDLRRSAVQQRFDYAALLAFWQHALPNASLHPQIFDQDRLIGGNVVSDFMSKIGFDTVGLTLPRVENQSLSVAAQIYLRAVNEACAKGSPIDRPKVVRLMNKHFAGKGRKPLERDAAKMERYFTASNECIRAQYFPELTSLFVGKHNYPKMETQEEMTEQDYLAIVKMLSRKPAPLNGRDLLTAVLADSGLHISLLGRLRRWARNTTLAWRR